MTDILITAYLSGKTGDLFMDILNDRNATSPVKITSSALAAEILTAILSDYVEPEPLHQEGNVVQFVPRSEA